MMLVEGNALELAQRDGKRIARFIEKGQTLNQISKTLLVRILKQIKLFDSPTALEEAKRAVNAPRIAQTFSEQISARLLALYEAATPHLHPEDSRALGLYLIGVPPEVEGIIQHTMTAIGESSAQNVVQICAARIQAKLDRMRQQDQVLFQEQIKLLPEPKQRIVAGHLLDAQWSFSGEDGIGARNHVIAARKLCIRWLRIEARNKKMGIE